MQTHRKGIFLKPWQKCTLVVSPKQEQEMYIESTNSTHTSKVCIHFFAITISNNSHAESLWLKWVKNKAKLPMSEKH
jgi:hypothetical protein